MCGIAGWLAWDGTADADVVRRMAGALIHRGPDNQGTATFGPLVLGHTRLAIIDLDAGSNQPMTDENSGLTIVYNGEIYNFESLRRDLEAKGARFRTKSDTEVVLHAYREWGEECLGRFNGMFAFALWDAHAERLFLARDRVGKKPLYYRLLPNGGLVFASEVKALRLHPVVGNTVNPDALGHFLSLNYTLTDACILAGVEKLPAAHCMVLDRGKPLRITEYWDLAQHFHNKRNFRSEAEAAEALDELIEDAVRLRLVSDVPLGAFLSGGIDSTSIVAAMTRTRPADQNETFSIGFHEKTYSELPEARVAARHLGVNHHDRVVDADMAQILPAIVRAADEPFADTSMIPFYHLAQFARQRVTVCLSGDGGDELFAGYETYVADRLHRYTRWCPAWASSGLARIVDTLWSESFDKVSFDFKLRRFLRGCALDARRAHVSWRTIFSEADKSAHLHPDVVSDAGDPYGVFERHYDRVAGCHFLDQAMYVDIKTWLVDDILVKVDRATMAHSLEARAPLLDYRIVEFAAALPVDWKLKGLRRKYLFKQSQRRHLPGSVVDRRKKGFNAPVSQWLAGDLYDMAFAATTDDHMTQWFDLDAIRNLWSDHRSGRRDNGLKLFGLTCLGLWLQGS